MSSKAEYTAKGKGHDNTRSGKMEVINPITLNGH
jgi:hypothetical protein